MKTVYISIGNSDDKLTQFQWSTYYENVDTVIRHNCRDIYGVWVSPSHSMYQNACWAVDIEDFWTDRLKFLLLEQARQFHQESIAWAEVTTEFLSG